MRLQAIKLAGFKSFVDPTTVPFPGNLCAVVGPNGCGKSNIIDAVRWVMGESSAKTLRGESMSDVIFNGSNSRKPVGQASIELQFDNTDGRLTGEYAHYSEISIRRKVTRDGQSSYFLNGHKCRRRDITDIFLGTGLGPRSYSIIEQGMISLLIEAKPEDLRMYLEEAAGISRYRERRRETGRRIGHTRQNLERLNDLREEIDSQLHRLKSQAKAAERYTGLRREQRTVKARIKALRYQAISSEAAEKEAGINSLIVEQESYIADQRRIEAETEQQRQVLVELTEESNEIQGRFYNIGTEIARIEDGIQYRKETTEQQLQDLEQIDDSRTRVEANLEEDEHLVSELTRELADVRPEYQRIHELEETSGSRLVEVERDVQSWQQTWDDFNHTAAEARQQGEVQQSRIEHLEQTIERATKRLNSLNAEMEQLLELTDDEEIRPLEELQTVQEEQLASKRDISASLLEQIEQQRDENTRLSDQLDSKRADLQRILGRRESLETLQREALGLQEEAEKNWLIDHGLTENPRLVEKLKVEDDWVLAMETVLGETLQAVCVSSADTVGALLDTEKENNKASDSAGEDPSSSLKSLLDDFSRGSLKFISDGKPDAAEADIGQLAARVSGDIDVTGLLHGIHTADSLAEALAMHDSLAKGESVVTRDGLWLGSNWLCYRKDTDTDGSVIRRQTELDELVQQIEILQHETASQSLQLIAKVADLAKTETSWNQQQNGLAEQQKLISETQAQLTAKQMRSDQRKADIERTRNDLKSCKAGLSQDETLLSAARTQLQHALDQIELDEQERAELSRQHDDLLQELDTARARAESHRQSVHALAMRMQSLESRIDSAEQAVFRLTEQQQELTERGDSLQLSIRENEAPQANLGLELEENLAERLQVENELANVRQSIETIESGIRELERQRSGVDSQFEQVRDRLDNVQLDHKELEIRQSTIREQMDEEKSNLEEVIAAMPKEADEEAFENDLNSISNRIHRMGPINLAALDEYSVQSERKQYLDAQNEDLEKALSTLENAIRKIDMETRTRFKVTFDNVNGKLQQMFPKLFGGGHAYLQMTGTDLLDTGVEIMARPPGKRNSSIHMLSGGEKALTAIALVFSIFSLNPAPFCLLDEVDAPLDDVNVARFSDLVREMSRTIQFIYITHNKIAMEMGEQLMGVTMQEPGVSRLVSVDVEEAVAMAAM